MTYAHRLTPEIQANAARTNARRAAILARQHERFVASIEDFERRFDAWGDRLEEACAEYEALKAKAHPHAG